MRGGRSYRVQCQLGRGAFGAVYLAETVGTGLERRVAVKLLRPEKAAEPGLVGRLRDEARMLAAIRHRAIVRVDDLVELDGTWAIVMEYVEGCDLTELLGRRPVPPVAALAIAEEVASALHAAAHQAGPDGKPLRLIHRDIKPSNLRITAQGEVKILDFGVARAELSAREEATQEAAFGTVPYMAPERFYGEDSHAGDIYALGVTLFEMLTGVKPGKTAMDSDRQPPGERLRAQWAWLAEISQPLHDLVASMMAKKPGDRPTARETARNCATIRASLPGESLDEWAENVVPGALKIQEERRATAAAERTGTILVERSGSHPLSGGTRPRPGGGVPAWLAAPAALLIAGGAAAAIIVPAVWWGLTRDRGAESAVASPGATTAPPARPREGAVGAAASPTGTAAVADGAPVPGSTGPGSSPSTPAGTAPATKPTAHPADGTAASGQPSTSGPPAATVTSTPAASNPAASTSPTKPTPAAAATASTGKPSAAAGPATPPAAEATPTPPAEVAPTGPGKVTLSGDAVSATLRGSAGTFGPGEVPVGNYTAEVSFADGTTVALRSVPVESGRATQLRCSKAFQNCKVITD